MASQIQIRRDTAANWTSINPTLAQGEIGLETDSGKIKIGTGAAAWTALSYFVGNLPGATLDALGDVTITSVQNGDFLRYNGSASAWINDPVNLSTDTVGDYVQSLVAGTGLTINNNSGEGSTPTLNIGQDVGTSASVLFAMVETSGDLTVFGNLTVSGDTTSLLTDHLMVKDPFVTLNAGATGAPSIVSGIEIERGSSANVYIHWNETTDKWETTNDGSTYSVIATNGNIALGTDTTGNYVSGVSASTGVTVDHTPGEGSTATISIGQSVSPSASVSFANVTSNLVGNVTGNLTGNVTGNADTATTLDNARTISVSGDVSGSVSFDGSQDVNIAATIQPNSVALGTDTTGDYVSYLVAGTGVSLTLNSGESATPEISIGQDVATSASVTFASVTAPLIGNATTASELEHARTISLSGDVSGSVSFDGSANAQITTTIQPNSVALGTDTTGNYMSDLTQGTGVTITHTPGEGSNATIAIGQAVGTSSSVTFAAVNAPLTGNVTGNLTGNADTATALANSRTIELTGDVTGSVSFNGTANASISATIAANSVALGTDTTGNYMSDLTQGTGVTITHTPGEGSNATIAIGQAIGTSDSPTFAGLALNGGIAFEGATANDFETAFVAIDPTADRTISLPDTSGTVVTTGDTGTVTSTMISNGTIVNADINALAGIELSKLATSTAGNIIVYNASGIPTSVTESGDITISDAGVTAISSGVIVNADVNASAAIAHTKLADASPGQVLLGTTTTGAITATTISGDITIDGAGVASIAANSVALGTDTTGSYVSSLVAGTGLTITNNTGETATPTVAIGQDVATTASVLFAQVETTGSLFVGQNLYVSGSVVTENQTSLQIDDPFIYLASSGSATLTDFGIAGNYNDGTYHHAGIFRDASDGKWKFFDSYEPEPSHPINTEHASYSPAVVVGEFFESLVANGTAPLTVSSSTVVANLNSDFLDGQHGSYYAPLASPTFTGTVTLPTGTVTSGMILDGAIVNADINADAAIALSKLTHGTSGQIIVANSSGVPTWVSETGDITISDTGVTAISSGVIVNADINASAGIELSKLATSTAGNIIVYNSSGVPTAVTETGDITISDLGVTSISSGVIVNDDISATAAIAHSKLANATSGQVLLGTTTTGVVTATTISGDITINGAGVASISANSVALGTDTTGNYVSDVSGGTGVTVTHTPGEGSTPSIAIGQSVATSASVTFAAVTAALIGNASTVTNGVYTTSSINALADVDTVSASPTANQFLKWDGTNWVPGTVPTINYLDDIGDVSASAPSSGQFLKWNGSAWVADSVPTINTLDDVGDVTITSVAVGQTIAWSGSAWVNSSVVRDNLVRFYMEVM